MEKRLENQEFYTNVSRCALKSKKPKVTPMIPVGNFLYHKATIGTTITVIEANSDAYCFPKTNRTFPAVVRIVRLNENNSIPGWVVVGDK